MAHSYLGTPTPSADHPRIQKDLDVTLDYVKALLKLRSSSVQAYFSVRPAQPEELTLVICARDQRRCDVLRKDTRLRAELDGYISDELAHLCQAGALRWNGYVIDVRDVLQGQFGEAALVA